MAIPMENIKQEFMKLLYILFIISIIGCNNRKVNNEIQISSNNITNIEMDTIYKFDINKFKLNVTDNRESYEFINERGDKVQQFMSGDIYVEYIYPQDSLFIIYSEYYNNGVIKERGERYYQGRWKKGIWKYYDQGGELIESIDEDISFKYTWEDVLSFTKKNSIDIYDYNTRIIRIHEDGKFWIIMWHDISDGIDKIAKTIYIDGDTGKVISKKEAGIEK
jgi:hypothetical protein